MNTPYVPPKATERPLVVSGANRILRWIGALCFGYLAVMTFFSDFISLSSKFVSVPLNAFLAIGLVRLGRKFCIGVAILMVVMISVQAYYNKIAIANPESIAIRIPDSPWLVFARSIIPHLSILVCVLALSIRIHTGTKMQNKSVDATASSSLVESTSTAPPHHL